MSMDKQMAVAQLLARFKLQVKRTLGETVDLERITRDADYTRQRLAEIEEAALDEDLLVMVLRLRDHLLPPETPPTPAPVAAPAAPEAKETRRYLMGARSW
ncbi:hypothetical protein [Dechloromonas sp. H13]|uniref:hypothetical protein n=1 Tax=Dechloromonas sp. H13 TaxID=2570193 RepID=UPI001291AA6C|nr:hypothetical protein [Dechloromonas sp. H13]